MDGIAIDRCSYCRGIWFDSGELEAFFSSKKRPGSDNPFAGTRFEPVKGRVRRVCPCCETDSLRFGTVSDYEVWKCDGCSGLFVFSETVDQFIPLNSTAKVGVGLASLLDLLGAVFS